MFKTKKWKDLTSEQQKQAKKTASFIGYKEFELSKLLYSINKKDNVCGIRDKNLLKDIFSISTR